MILFVYNLSIIYTFEEENFALPVFKFDGSIDKFVLPYTGVVKFVTKQNSFDIFMHFLVLIKTGWSPYCYGMTIKSETEGGEISTLLLLLSTEGKGD